MRHMASVMVMGLALMGVTVPAVGADNQSTMMVLGAGLQSCASWAQGRTVMGPGDQFPLTRQGAAALSMYEWVRGFLTGMNAWTATARGVQGDITDGDNLDGALAWIDNYCADNPFDDLHNATAGLTVELWRRQGIPVGSLP